VFYFLSLEDMAKEKKKKSSTKHDPKKIQDMDRVVAALSYVWIFVLIPYIFFHHNKWVYAHARSGLVLFIFELILLAISIIPILGWLAAGVGWIFVVLVAIIGVAHALAGQKYEIPLLNKYVPKK